MELFRMAMDLTLFILGCLLILRATLHQFHNTYDTHSIPAFMLLSGFFYVLAKGLVFTGFDGTITSALTTIGVVFGIIVVVLMLIDLRADKRKIADAELYSRHIGYRVGSDKPIPELEDEDDSKIIECRRNGKDVQWRRKGEDDTQWKGTSDLNQLYEDNK